MEIGDTPFNRRSRPEPQPDELIHFIRSQLLERLSLATWINASAFIEAGHGEIQNIEWTEKGIAKIRQLHGLLRELDYFSGASCPPRRIGEMDLLMDMIGLCILKHKPS
jgi:hypothetical protein